MQTSILMTRIQKRDPSLHLRPGDERSVLHRCVVCQFYGSLDPISLLSLSSILCLYFVYLSYRGRAARWLFFKADAVNSTPLKYNLVKFLEELIRQADVG